MLFRIFKALHSFEIFYKNNIRNKLPDIIVWHYLKMWGVEMSVYVIRTLLLYVLVLVMMRIMGKRQISDLQTNELVVTLLISNIAAIPIQDTSLPLLSGAIPIILLVACEILVSFLMLKNGKFRRLICGKPQIIIHDGTIDQKKMKLLRISTEDLMEQLRQEGIFAIEDVRYAVIETNGMLSVLKKPDKDSVTAEQLSINNATNDFEVVIISDGELAEDSMNLCGITKEWLNGILTENNLTKEDVFIMTATSELKYNIVKKEG